jgi:L-erythro-3,5-diaminohexanoate dehydrogenase
MLIGTVDAVGPDATLAVQVGQQITTLVSLSLTPLVITDGLVDWDGLSEQVPCQGHAILFGRTIAASVPDDLPPTLAMAVMDVAGAPALTARVVDQYVRRDRIPTVAVVGGAGKSGSLSLAAARDKGAAKTVGVVPFEAEAELLTDVALADHVALADARDPVALSQVVTEALGRPADITVVCVDVPGCEHGAILATSPEGGTVIFFSMATSFTAAALGAEGLAADVTMLIGNGYTPGHAEYAFDLLRRSSGVRDLFTRRLDHDTSGQLA